ncbi:MAG: glycosyltransferase [Pirellulales bacterium]|nr:glycosyltransferase [Pirellulales bacterium]
MKILFLQKRLLFPANTGGKIRTLNVVRHLAQWHDVTYLSNILPEEEPFLDEMKNLGLRTITIPWTEAARESLGFYVGLATNLVSRYPFTVNKDYDPRLQAKAAELIGQGEFDLLICDFVQMARNAMNVGRVPKLLFQHNVEAQIYRRMADNESNSLKRWFIGSQHRKMESFERNAGRSFERVVAVSPQDKEIFAREYGWNHVDVIDTAVDTEYFSPQDEAKLPGKLVFVGSMDWLPNQEGVLRFVRDVLPLIQRDKPDVTVDIVGRNPPAAISRLGDYPGVTVTGSVDDVRPYVAQAEIAIVPLYAGGGTRLKIFEFMAMGTPVISTTIGAEGLSIVPEEHWLRADEDADFAGAVKRLLDDRDQRQRLSENALNLVQTKFSSEAIARQFESICQKTVAR